MFKITNIPNKLTISRIVMIFIFLFLANVEKSRYINVSLYWEHWCSIAAYIIAILAGITDILDGYIARKYHMESDFGKLMDPLADKIFITATFLMLVDKGFMPAWIAVVVISREFLVTGLRLLAANKGEVIAADKLGKLKTATQMFLLLVAGAIWVCRLNKEHAYRIYWEKYHFCWDALLMTIALITVYSGVSYFVRYRHLYYEQT